MINERPRIAILRAEATFSGCVNWSATSTEFLRGIQGQFATECVENTSTSYSLRSRRLEVVGTTSGTRKKRTRVGVSPSELRKREQKKKREENGERGRRREKKPRSYCSENE